MQPDEYALAVWALESSCAAAGGIIASQKRRRPAEGLLLGLLLGPVGVVIEALKPSIGRPAVCKHARDSLRSVITYQDAPARRAGRG